MSWKIVLTYSICAHLQFQTGTYVLYFEEFLIHDSRGFMILRWENSPHTSTQFSVFTYIYFDHFQFTSPDSILNIPPCMELVQPLFLYSLLEYYFLFAFLVFFVKSEKYVFRNLSAIHESKFSGKHLFFQFSLPHTQCNYFLFTQTETYFLFTPELQKYPFCLPSYYIIVLFYYRCFVSKGLTMPFE